MVNEEDTIKVIAEKLEDYTYTRHGKGIATCGGPIDILVITKDYTKFIRHKILNP